MNRLTHLWRTTVALLGVSVVALAPFGYLEAKPPTKPTRGTDAGSTARTVVLEGTNQNPKFMVRVSVDRADHTYVDGTYMTATVRSEEPGYLYLFNIDAAGKVLCLFPNEVQSNNQIQANQDIVIPDPNSNNPNTFKFKCSLQGGTSPSTELLKAVVTKQPLKELSLAELQKGAGPKKLDIKRFRSVIVEASTGQQNGGQTGGQTGGQVNQTDARQHAAQWAEHDAEFTIVPVGQPAQAQKRVGIFVGISEYTDPQIPTLQCSHLDAKNISSIMQQRSGVTEATVLLNKDATLANFRNALTNVVNTTHAGDMVVIYWSGHGGRCASVDGSGTDGYDAYLVPTDGDTSSAQKEQSSMLLDKTFGRWVQELDGRKVVVILDTCHSGGQIAGVKGAAPWKMHKFAKGIDTRRTPANARWTAASKSFLAPQVSRMRAIGQRDATVLASCTFKQVSFERMEQDMGVMTFFLHKALANGQSPETLTQISNQIAADIKGYVQKNFDGASQDIVCIEQTGGAPPILIK
jgi:hypothetical protein